MTTFTGTFSGHPFQLRLIVTLVSQSVANNTSTLTWNLAIVKTANFTPFNNSSSSFSGSVDSAISGTYGPYSFNGAIGQTLVIGSGTKVVTHGTDGSKSISVSASTNAAATIGTASLSGSMDLPTIPRASVPTLSSSSFDAGATVTIDTNRASSGFTHTATYAFGSATGTIDTDIEDSVDWTPPLSLLSQIPNAPSGAGTITLETFNGTTSLGTKTVSFTLNAGSGVVPTLTGVTATEATAGIATSIGAFVQGASTLDVAITGAAGVYGSTITGYKITASSQVVNAASGTTGPITASGTVNVVGTVTDSRGRTASYTQAITVLAYAPPVLTAVSAERALSSGTPDDDGTYIRANINAAVQSLTVSSTEKNALTYKISTRLHGTSTWTLKKTVSPGGVTFDSYDTVSTYDISNSYDVLVQVSDLLATSQIALTVSTSAVFMHWDGSDGVGIGKYRENGMLDVGGDVYVDGDVHSTGDVEAATLHQGDALVLDQDDIGTDADVTAGDAEKLATTAMISAAAQATSKIVNGSFRTNQRSYASGASIPIGLYCFDRWKASGVTNLITNPSAETNTTGWTASGATFTRDTGFGVSGTCSFKLVGTASNDSFIVYSLPTVIGKTYTVSATARLTGALTGAEMVATPPRARAIYAYDAVGALGASAQAPNAAGTTRLSVTFTATQTTSNIRLYHGQTGGTIWWDAVLATEGSIVYPYFDGATTDCSWSGTANASTSYSVPNVVPTLTFTADPHGQPVTLNTGGRISQIIERADVVAGTYTIAHDGTAQVRAYNNTTAPGSRPAFADGPIQVAIDGTDDVVVEFVGAGTIQNVRMYAGSTDFGFALPDIGDELQACQRYYVRFGGGYVDLRLAFGMQVTTTRAQVTFILPMPLRGEPVIAMASLNWTDTVAFNAAISGVTGGGLGRFVGGGMTVNSVTLDVTFAANGVAYRPGFVSLASTSGHCDFDAELY